MNAGDQRAHRRRVPLVERQARRIANSRNVTFAMALTFLAVAMVGAVAMRLLDSATFPSFDLAVWWAVQTVTTVGYGDVVPTSDVGRGVAVFEMVVGVSFISFLTAAVTSTVVRRDQVAADEAMFAQQRDESERVIAAIEQLNTRLDRIESSLKR